MTALCQQVLGRAPARPVRGETLAGRSDSSPITSHFSPLTSHVTSRRSSHSPLQKVFEHFGWTQLSEIARHRFLDPFSGGGR